jgi:hypothetical protein
VEGFRSSSYDAAEWGLGLIRYIPAYPTLKGMLSGVSHVLTFTG